jgi:hypothetical protein
VAAGNDGGVMSVLGQASQEFDNIFTVGAGDINGRSIYSSFGRGLDILADGGTTEHPALSTVGNDLGTMAGTSVATAKVAGAASLVWAANPALNYRQVMQILESTARDLGTPGWDDETGFGFLNTLAAVDLAKKTQPEVYQPTDFGTPTTWGGEGKVTPSERAVNFNGAIDWGKTSVQNNAGVNLRSGPGTGYDILGRISSGDTLEFDSQTEGDFVNDPNGEGSSSTWYRLADGSGWMSGLYVQYLGEIASPSPSPDPSPSPSPDPSPSPSPDPSPSPSPDPSPSPSPDPSPSPISTFSQIVQDVGYVHDLGYLRVRNGPGTDASGYQQVGTVSPGNTLIFDGQTQGESVYDPALGESTTWYRLADGSGWVSGLYMGAASTPTPSPSPSPTQPNPFDNVRQMFLDAARQYPQVGNAITDVQDQGGGVFRQEFERAIMIWNGQQVTVYETKGRSASTTSPSSKPAPVNNINWQNFSLQVGATKGVNLRNSPQFGDRSSTSIPYQAWMEFDGWTYGEPVNDLWNGQPDSLWLKVKGQNLWVPSAYMIGYPPGYKQPGSSAGNTGNTGGGKPILNFNSGGKSPNGNWTYLNAESGGGTITGTTRNAYILQLQKEISDIHNEIKKQTARINESNNFIEVLGKENTELSNLITTTKDSIKKIKEDWFWWFNSDKKQEISQLDEIIKQAEGQQKLDKENINYWNSQKTEADLQANQKRTELQQKETELQKLTFTGTVQLDAPPVRNMPTDVGNSRLNVVFKKGENLTFGGWTVDNKGRKWFSIVDSEERWIWEQNIDLNGALPESLKIQPVNNSQSKQVPDTIPAKKAVIGGGTTDSSIKGSFAKDIIDAVQRGVIRSEVGLFLMSILATESGGGDWQADNKMGFLGAFQMGKSERNRFAPGVSDANFLANKDIQLKAAQGLYGEKLGAIREVELENRDKKTTEPDKQPLDKHFFGKSELYKVAYAWLTLNGVDGNGVYSKDYASAAVQSAQLIQQTLG